ncbi:hypothetical protein Ddc_24576 [Ditylenchus destructor]|nr:hypothetical protein Ddc_24576 [Ditylenchus destructor]
MVAKLSSVVLFSIFFLGLIAPDEILVCGEPSHWYDGLIPCGYDDECQQAYGKEYTCFIGLCTSQSVYEKLSVMNRTTLLLFLSVFVLSEPVWTANELPMLMDSRAMRYVREVSPCVTNSQCDASCKYAGAKSGTANPRYDQSGYGYCTCHPVGEEFPDKYPTKEICIETCKILGVGGGQLYKNNQRCICDHTCE